MTIIEQSPCPRCHSEGPHNISDPEDDGNDAELVLTCTECGFEWQPDCEQDDCEHESTFEEQFENASLQGTRTSNAPCRKQKLKMTRLTGVTRN